MRVRARNRVRGRFSVKVKSRDRVIKERSNERPGGHNNR